MVVAQFHGPRVEIEEHHRGEPGEPLVPIDESVIPHDRVQKRRRFQLKRRIGIGAEGARLGTSNCRVKQTDVSDRAGAKPADQSKEIVEVEEFDFAAQTEPSRSSTSPHRSIMRSAMPSTRAA